MYKLCVDNILFNSTLPKLKGRQGLLYFQVRLCVRWKGENTKAVLKSFERNLMIFSQLHKQQEQKQLLVFTPMANSNLVEITMGTGGTEIQGKLKRPNKSRI